MQVQPQRNDTSNLSIKNQWSFNNAQAIIESLVDPLFILDEHGLIIEVNSYAEELFEYSKEELIGHINISQLIPILNLDNEESRSKYFERSIITTGLRKSTHENSNNQIEINISLACYSDKDSIGTSTNNGGTNSQSIGFYLVSVRDITKQLTEIEWSKSRYYTEFKEIKCIGKGGFGSVFLAKNKLDEQIYAIKKIPLQCHPQDYIECMNLMSSDDDILNKDEYGCCSMNSQDDMELKCNKHNNENEKIVENMKSTLTLDDLRVIREVKNFAKFKSHPNVVRYYASWVEPVLLNDELQAISGSKLNLTQENLVSPFDHVHPNTPVVTGNGQGGIPNSEHYSIYDSIDINPMDVPLNQNTKNNNYNLNNQQLQNQNQINNYTTLNTKSKANSEKEDEDFDIFGNGPTNLQMITSVSESFVGNNNNISPTTPIQSQQTSYNYSYNSKEKEILDFMPSSFEAYSSFNPQQPTNSSLIPKNALKDQDNGRVIENNSIQNRSHSLSSLNDNLSISDGQDINSSMSYTKNNIIKNDNIENLSQYNINVRNFYKNCDNQHSFSNDNIEVQNSYSTIHDSHSISINNIQDSTTGNDQTSSVYANDSIYDTHHSDSASAISDDDESSLTLLELPVINTSNEELNMLSTSQNNLNTFSENELTTNEDNNNNENTNEPIFNDFDIENKEEINTQFSEKDDIFLAEQEEEESYPSDNGEIPFLPRDTSKVFDQCQSYNSTGGINIPNKGENKRHQSDNETSKSYNSTYSNNSIKTMLLDNQFSLDDRKDNILKTQDTIHEEPLLNQYHARTMDSEFFEEANDSNNNQGSLNNSNPNDYFDDEFSSGSSVSTIVDDCDLAKNAVYQIPATTMLYIQMEYSSPNNLRKWIRERNAKIWKHAPFLNNNQDDNNHVRHSKHWFLDHINRKKNLSILQQIAMGLEHIHKSGFIHRDIKPANIFMCEDRIMIGDFGLAKRYIKGSNDYDINDLIITDEGDEDHVHHLEMLMKEEIANENNNCSMKTVKMGGEHDLTLGVGTLLYASPEQLSRKPYSFATDIYSLSVIMLELFFPFCTSFDRMAQLVNLRRGEIPDCLKKRWPEECSLLLSMANVDPQQRPTISEVLNTINQLLTNQPSKFSNIKNLYLPKRYDLFNPVFHAQVENVDNDLSKPNLSIINDINDRKISETNIGFKEPKKKVTVFSNEEKSIDEEKFIDDESDGEKEKIKLLIDKLHQIQLNNSSTENSESGKDDSLNELINPVLEILSKKHNYNSRCHTDNIHTQIDISTKYSNSSKSLDSYLNNSSISYDNENTPKQNSGSKSSSINPDIRIMINGEDVGDKTPQSIRINKYHNPKDLLKHHNQNQRVVPYFETKGYNLGTNNSNTLFTPRGSEISTGHLSPTNYSITDHDNKNSNNLPTPYNVIGRRRNSYSPSHSNEYYLSKLKGIDHDSYYLTSPPSTSQHIYRHDPNMNSYYDHYLTGQRFRRRNNNRRSSLPNPNRLAYTKDYYSSSSSSSSSSQKPSSSSFCCLHKTSKINTFDVVAEEDNVVYNHENGECQCDKCCEQESLVLGLLAENATLAKRIKELERRINSNSNSISPFGYHRTGKLK